MLSNHMIHNAINVYAFVKTLINDHNKTKLEALKQDSKLLLEAYFTSAMIHMLSIKTIKVIPICSQCTLSTSFQRVEKACIGNKKVNKLTNAQKKSWNQS